MNDEMMMMMDVQATNTACQLRPLLAEKCVILTGGRDKLNNIIIQFPSDAQLDKMSTDDLQAVILYLASIPCSGKKSFVFVIDMRGRKYEAVKPILKILQNLQESFNYNIDHVYIIKPENFWQKQKTSFASSKYSFEHSMISIEQLNKYIDPSQLTSDFDGSLPYNHEQWIDFRIKLENYLNQSSDLLSKLSQLQIELNSFEQPETRESCQEAIMSHANTKQRVFGINIDQLMAEGRNLMRSLMSGSGGGPHTEEMLASGTRDSGYSGSSEADFSVTSGAAKFGCDYFGEAAKIKEPVEHMRVAKQKVQSLWQQKKLKLEQCLQLRMFEQDCNQMMEWINYQNKCVLMNYTDIGQSYASAYELLQKHEQFHKSSFSGAASIQHITSVANKLIASSHYASNLIGLKASKLEKEWQLFHSALQNRQKILSASCMFHNKADQYLNKVGEWKSLCTSQQVAATSVQEAEALLTKHHELSDEISQIYAEVCNDGKAILDSIQSSQSTQIGQMEFKQAASHILDIVYEILRNHRQLEILWVDKKQKLQNRYRILNFQQNIKNVYNWLENHGEVFLRRNQSIGKNLMRAKMLHLSHENFVKVLKNTITNVEKLLASADDLVINGEYDPQEIYSMTKELEQRMTSFLQRVEKRKNILDLSVLFHTHVAELDKWFNELKHQWNTANLSDLLNQSNPSTNNNVVNVNIDLVSSCLENLEKHLDVLNEQKSVTLDAVEKTLDEGGALLAYLKEVNKHQQPSVNTDDLNNSNQDSPANNTANNKPNSYAHLENILQTIRNRYSDVDKMLCAVKAKLEQHVQFKQFEKDALEASQNLEQWAEELKYLDSADELERSSETAESWLHTQIQTANQMQVLVFEILQRGSDLLQQQQFSSDPNNTPTQSAALNELFSGAAEAAQANSPQPTSGPTTPTAGAATASQHTLNWLKQQNALNSTNLTSPVPSFTARQRIQSLVDYLNEREKELHELAIKQQRRLGQTLQINQLENECSQLLNYIANIEQTLFSLLKFARTLDEAEHIKKEHEMFKANLERVSTSVSMLQSKSQRILLDKHQQQHQQSQQQQQQNQNRVVTKFEQLMSTLNSKWERLLIHIDNRTRLIMAQINFYKYTDQVTTVLESLEAEYSRDEDWYEKSRSEYDPDLFLQSQIQLHNQKKQSFLKACNWARRTGETFQKYSMRNICDTAKSATPAMQAQQAASLHEIEANTRRIMDEIHMKEERTIKSWTKRKNALDECYQYVIFEKSSKEALAWLHQSEQCYVSKFQQTLASNNRDEIKRLYKEFAEFADQVRTQQEYVNVLIELSPKLLESSSSRFAANIAAWANKVETRYKEFFSLMAKVQQQHGLGGSGAINNNAAAPNAGSLNSSMNSLSSQVSAVCASPSLSSNQSSFLTLTSTSSNNVESSKTLLSSSTSEQTPVISNNKSTIETNKSKQEIFKQNEQKQKLIKKRRNIITEIIQTEKSYVQDLCACLDTYYKEFLSNANSLPEYLKGKETVVFGNLEEIYNFHKKTFLVELENYENMPEDIGHCFVIYADQFQIYVEYCKNKENSTKLLMEDSRNENFFEKIQRNGQLKCSLDSYLIKPIQRITKYQLLLKDLLTCCEETSETRSETRDALDVMMSVPKKANDAIHLSLLEGLDVDGLSKEALGDVLLQDRFFVWDSKQIIKKGKERHVFLFETSLVFAKEVKDVRGKLKYVYKFKLMTSEVNITEHMEGDACKLAVWTGRAPLSDHRVVLKSPSLEVKQAWVKKIRELIQEKYFYMEVAMCEAASSGGNGGNRSNRNSNNFELLDQNGHDLNTNSSSIHTNSMMIENFSSAASNASSGTKASSEITTLQSDYVTSDNVHLFKGQHVQIVQRLNNDLCLVQLLNNLELSSPTSTMSSVNSKQQQPQPSTPQQSQQVIEVQIPISLVKSRSSNRAHINFDDDVEDTTTSGGGGGGGKSVGSTKRKGSFKKWLRSSHRKLTSNASNNSSSSSMTARKEIINGGSGAKLLLGSSDSENLKIKKVLSNSEDLKIKNWLIEEPNNEENEANHLSEQTILENPTAASTTIPSSSSNASTTTTTPNRQISQQQHQQENQPTTPVAQQTSNGNDQEDQEDTSFIPPPMNVIKPEQSEQNSTSGSFNKIPNQSIDIQKELKLWQSKMENSKKQLGASGSGSDQQQQQQQVDSSQAPTQLSPNPTPSMAETKLTYAIKELLTTERDYVTDLSNLIDKFMEGIKRNEIPMPQDMVGKEMIVFGNVQQIYEWHKSTFFPDLEKCLSEPPNYIAQLFIKYENRFQMYVKYCENKPKSEFIVSEYDTYFEELRQKLNQKLNIQDLLIKPIQRIMKYQLMLKEIRKFMDKEHMDCRLMDRAIEITITVPKNADDMMNLGRLQGFEGRITAQGRLLLQDTLLVHDSTSDEQKPTKKNAKSSSSESGGGDKQANKFKERRVFLFQQIIIFSEMVGPANPKSKFTSPKYIFKCDMKVNKLKLEKDDAQLTFTLLDKTPDITPRKIVCLCEDAAKYNNWINQLQDLLDMQNQFLRDLQNPQAAIQKIGSAGSSGSMSSPISSGGGGGKANHHHKDKDQQHPSSASSSSASSSHHHGIVGQVNDFFKSAFTFSSSSSSNSSGTTAGATSPPLNQQPMSPGVLNNTNHSNRSSGTSIATTPTTISPSLAKQASSGSGGRSNTSLNTASTTTNDHLSSELAQQLTINNTTTSTNSDSRKNSGSGNGNGNGNTAPGIVLAKCIVSYTAVTEDEISVQKGDVVQIMMANMHNRYMVHREADGQQPAAEGWIPGSVIGSQFSSSSLSSSSSSTAANPISSPPQQLI